jgi:hypothetical protein
MKEIIDTHIIVVGNPEGKKTLGLPNGRWEDNIKLDLKKYCVRSWIGFVWLNMGSSGGFL